MKITIKHLKNRLLCLSFLVHFTIFSQNISIEVCTGRGNSTPEIKWSGTSIDNNITEKNKSIDSRSFFSIGITGQLEKYLYLKVELGTNSFENRLDFNFGSNRINGLYRSDYVYGAFLPELRLLKNKWLYMNAGYGLYQPISSSLTGTNPKTADDFRDGATTALIFNIGANPSFDTMGIIFNLGYAYIYGTSRDVNTTPTIGFSQWSFKLGINYKIK
jgi:hypothetical protein